ncbi:carboxypeptidase-like regulatory domain-containing protein [Winogradskyella echinorum]|uniref:Carboxypeptidase-like regulatory domain-containing protein n=1 Tax=Winogradskyella echinorum TaxID=538189 RepID=A0ABR6XY30_9FLAO|nr:carboxypeptidase-like regulatory domain-containing protein [Winogradskyella echinorum]MBC3845309.1 carboxypeptidase-like regulatory domain-containing protein [Winogradskyella echinorum]MBC5749657.1 carboxypeptidase-like regulatory domain-containing protein [Winogradskyella echinorum]
MKTQLKLLQTQTFKTFGLIVFMLFTLVAFNPVYGQTKMNSAAKASINERTIKGIVSDDTQPLNNVNITLKGTKIGTTTNEKGEFTFPKKLKTGDILLFSYLGYEKQEIEINDKTSFIKLVLTEDLIEMIGALDSNKPYKSKRKKN